MNAAQTTDLSAKRCSRCGIEQALDHFQWKNKLRGVRRSWCRDCAHAYGRQHYLDNLAQYKAKAHRNRRQDRARVRSLVDEYLANHPCVDCGATEIDILEFDHREPADKRAEIGTLVSNAGWPTVLKEIEKCDVRCASCHRRRTAVQFGWAKTRPLPKPEAHIVVPALKRLDVADVNFLKECIWCHWLKPLSEFAFHSAASKRLNSHCRTCHATYRHQHYMSHRERYFSQAHAQTRRNTDDKLRRMRQYLLAHPCVDCGATDIAALDFDHVDPATKEMEVARMVRRRNWAATELEIAKCVVRCANCHRRRTISQRVGAAA